MLIKTYIAIAEHLGLDINKLSIDVYDTNEKTIVLSDGSGFNVKIYSHKEGDLTVYRIQEFEAEQKELLQYLIDERLL